MKKFTVSYLYYFIPFYLLAFFLLGYSPYFSGQTQLILRVSAIFLFVVVTIFFFLALRKLSRDYHNREINQKKMQELVDQINFSCGTLASLLEKSESGKGRDMSLYSDFFTSLRSQNHNLRETFVLVTELNQLNKTLYDSINKIHKINADVLMSSRQAEDEVKEVTKKIHEINEVVDNSAVIVKDLFARSTQIVEIIDVISRIVDQTYLLALNASIEGQRAGSKGRGIKVVAREIRKLAQEAEEKATLISVLVKEILYGIEQAMSSMEKEMVKVAEGLESGDRTMETFQVTVVNIDNFSQIVIWEVLKAVKEQLSKVEEIEILVSNSLNKLEAIDHEREALVLFKDQAANREIKVLNQELLRLSQRLLTVSQEL